MQSSVQSTIAGFVVGLALAAFTAQAAQHDQHHPQAPAANATTAPAAPDKPMGMMMSDPAKHEEMMKQMAHCRDMMSMMMEQMKHEGMKKDQPAPHQ
jgi:hypothetical protein